MGPRDKREEALEDEELENWIEDAVASAPWMPVDLYMKRTIRNGIKKG